MSSIIEKEEEQEQETLTSTSTEAAFEELAQVIKEAIDDAVKQNDNENNLTDKSLNKYCAFCGKPKLDIPLQRGNKTILVCMECYQAAKAIMETNHK